MINLANDNIEIDSERQKAIATARMITYAAVDASELGLKECSQLLIFIADLIKNKFNLGSKELLMNVTKNDSAVQHFNHRGRAMQ